MGIADICLVIAFGDASALAVADKWLSEVELRDRAARLIRNAESYTASRKARFSLVNGAV